MSASKSVNGSSPSYQSLENTAPVRKKWHDRSFCSLDKVSFFFGVSLIITGIVLFVLNSLYSAELFNAAVSSVSIGGAVFTFGLCLHCAVTKVCDDDNAKTQKSARASRSRVVTTPQKQASPLDLRVGTREFFETKGIFGLPEDLIEEVEIWRAYRAGGSFDLALDAGFILEGPPGTGKTTIAQQITELLGGTYIEKKCGELFSKWAGETETNITNLFNVPEGEFRVIVIDEISGFLPKRRSADEASSWRNTVTEHFLGIVSGTTQTKPRYLLIGTTNDFQALDTALVRRGRLGKQFTIHSPKTEDRQKIFQYHLDHCTLSSDEEWAGYAESLAEQTKALPFEDFKANFSCADIVGLISDVKRRGILQKRPLTHKDFEMIVKQAIEKKTTELQAAVMKPQSRSRQLR